MLTSLVMAATLATHGSWVVTHNPGDDNVVAATVNDSGSVLAYACNKDSALCFWALVINENCTTDHKYPVLINSDPGSNQVLLTCADSVSGMYRYTFDDFEAMTDSTKAGGRIGFAFPLNGGDFRVVRFELAGLVQAKAVAEKWALDASKGSTRDITL